MRERTEAYGFVALRVDEASFQDAGFGVENSQDEVLGFYELPRWGRDG